ncbi:MAG: hypothetical protein ACOC56_00560 [Atribacterota bacterium]
MYKVNDFKIAELIIKNACRALGCPFVNLEIKFDSNDSIYYYDNVIHVRKPDSLGSTLYYIIYTYLDNFDIITGKKLFSSKLQKQSVFKSVINMLRTMSFNKDVLNIDFSEPIVQRLYQNRFIWVALKNIIEPLEEININNAKIVIFDSPFIDVAYYLSGDDNDSGPLIFSNADINYDPIKQAFIFKCALEYHNLCPNKVVSNIIRTDMENMLLGLAKLEFKDDEAVDDFYNTLKVICDIEITQEYMPSIYKMAQANPGQVGLGSNSLNTWWFLGLIEKMLDPARGPDWSSYEKLEPMHKKIWDKIEKERQKEGRDGVPYEHLLRIHSGELGPKEINLVERSLSSDRIW